MRVDEHTLNDAVSSKAGRAGETQRIQVGGTGSSTAAGANGDRVDLSSLTGRISHTMQALSHQSAQRVNHLRQDYRAGRYQPGAKEIGQALARS